MKRLERLFTTGWFAVENEREGPLVMVRGEGVRVWDEAGKEYLEGMSGLWCASLGFANERLAAVVAA